MTIRLEYTDYPNTFKGLPSNYNFEMAKCLRTIEKISARRVALQFPDGLLRYAPVIIDAIENYTEATCFLLGDVVYGACCVDDTAIECDLLIHYGHSCLIPIQEMETRVLYIFVDIKIDVEHLVSLIRANFTGEVALIGTIQFNSSVHRVKRILDAATSAASETSGSDPLRISIPRVRPLSAGEVLGCTSPVIRGVENVIYIGDGRFHLESAMIRNPTLNFFKYCPFSRKMTREIYDFDKMIRIRREQIQIAKNSNSFGIIVGSLGRQGNQGIADNVESELRRLGKTEIYRIVVDEINESILDVFTFIDAFIQVSCPRLSIDWGACYKKPLLSPFELFYDSDYQMDYYAAEGSAPWKNYSDGVYVKSKREPTRNVN